MRHLFLAALFLSGAAAAQQPAPGPSAPTAPDGAPQGYLAPGSFDLVGVLPAAPRKGDARYVADRAIFKQTRALKGTPRWVLATNDVSYRQSDVMRDFSCAAGVALTPDNAPRTAALLTRLGRDLSAASRSSKDYFKRERPFLIDRGPTCQPPAELVGSYDYPSGHAMFGWAEASVLAELIPDRATALLARGRAYGESRIVCGVHNASAVEAGRTGAAATLAAVSASVAFQAEMAGAREELAALRASAPVQGGQCEAEMKLVAQPVP